MKLLPNLAFLLIYAYMVSACKAVDAAPAGSTSIPGTTLPSRTAPTLLNSSNTPLPVLTDPSPAASDSETANPPTPTPALSGTDLCSPLGEIQLSQLQEMIVNPFAPPPPGSDDPHQGVDFAELFGTQRIAIPGRQVDAILSGEVAAVISDRFPYGNAVLVETRIGDLPLEIAAGLPTPAPTPQRRAALTCPDVHPTPDVGSDQQSLYLLYAHMQEAPLMRVGEVLICGQRIGNVGSSGNALNPHLHLEARLGPSGTRFAGMAHYDTRATPEEMAAYCLWRTSGHFQLVDPLVFLSLRAR